MDIHEFIDKFAAQFDDTERCEFTPETAFRKDLKEWSSITALSVIAMIDIEYSVKVSGDDLARCITVKDVYDIVNTKK